MQDREVSLLRNSRVVRRSIATPADGTKAIVCVELCKYSILLAETTTTFLPPTCGRPTMRTCSRDQQAWTRCCKGAVSISGRVPYLAVMRVTRDHAAVGIFLHISECCLEEHCRAGNLSPVAIFNYHRKIVTLQRSCIVVLQCNDGANSRTSTS